MICLLPTYSHQLVGNPWTCRKCEELEHNVTVTYVEICNTLEKWHNESLRVANALASINCKISPSLPELPVNQHDLERHSIALEAFYHFIVMPARDMMILSSNVIMNYLSARTAFMSAVDAYDKAAQAYSVFILNHGKFKRANNLQVLMPWNFDHRFQQTFKEE